MDELKEPSRFIAPDYSVSAWLYGVPGISGTGPGPLDGLRNSAVAVFETINSIRDGEWVDDEEYQRFAETLVIAAYRYHEVAESIQDLETLTKPI